MLPTDAHVTEENLGQAAPKHVLCAVCNAAVAKYKCPKCKIATCSLPCVTKHKAEQLCNGEKNPTDHVSFAEMSDSSLRKDFGFLSNVRTVVDNAKRGFERSDRFSFHNLPLQLHALRNAAKRKGVLCQFVSEGMSRRAANTSRFEKVLDTITWRLVLTFVSPSALQGVDVRNDTCPVSFEITTDWANERFLLKDLIEGGALTANPKLKEHPIVKGFVSAGAWVTGANSTAQPSAKVAEESIEPLEVGADEQDDLQSLGTPSLHATTPAGSLSPLKADGPVTSQAEGIDCDNEQHVVVDEEFISEQEDAATMQNRTRVKHYLSEVADLAASSLTASAALEGASRSSAISVPYAVLSYVERMPGRTRRYFKLDPLATIHENLRTIFFVNEFPNFVVVPASMIDMFHIMTDAEKVQFRETFRKRDRDGNTDQNTAANTTTDANGETIVTEATGGDAPKQFYNSNNRSYQHGRGGRGGTFGRGGRGGYQGRGGFDNRRGGGRGGRGTGRGNAAPQQPYVYGKDAEDRAE